MFFEQHASSSRQTDSGEFDGADKSSCCRSNRRRSGTRRCCPQGGHDLAVQRCATVDQSLIARGAELKNYDAVDADLLDLAQPRDAMLDGAGDAEPSDVLIGDGGAVIRRRIAVVA
jgi:hypothetical protein